MIKISDIPKFDRPREKLIKYGPDKLSNAELLAIILRTGTRELNVLKLAQKILHKFENKKLEEIKIDDLKGISGIGDSKASEIVACFELGKRVLSGKRASILLTPKDIWNRTEDIRSSKREHFLVFYLDSRNQEIKRDIISVGTLTESIVHPREVFENAIKTNSAAIIIAHNHPSGSLEPSQSDIEVTKKLIHAGIILDIRVISHIIVTSKSYVAIEI